MTNRVSKKVSSPNEGKLTVDKPATYCIQVVGALDEKWSDRLGGLSIHVASPGRKTSVTTLSGPVIDQAALFGVLKALYDMRLPLLYVECLEFDQNNNTNNTRSKK